MISHQMAYKSIADIIDIMKTVYNFKVLDGEISRKKKDDTNERKIILEHTLRHCSRGACNIPIRKVV